ncbi:MAG TPA: RIP metalloprotease RseP [Pyrinomonadaceae bacterium]
MIENLLFWILPFVFILGTAVVLHEFGHFIVAKLLGVRVETFSVGFGPRLFGRRFGPTDYRVSLIPLGGYVKLGGDESNAPVEGAGESNIPERERFDLRPRWQKFLVMVAGPVMNILTALTIAFVWALTNGVPVQINSPVVERVREGGAAQAAGLRPGDRIVSFNGKDDPTWERIQGDATLSPDQPLPVTVEREGRRVELTLKPQKETIEGESIGIMGLTPTYSGLKVLVNELTPDWPAAQAGLQAGDRLIAVNGEPVRDSQGLIEQIQRFSKEPIRLTYERNGQQQEVTLAARLEGERARIGVLPQDEPPYQQAGLLTAAGYAVRRNVEVLRMTGAAFGQIFKGQRSARESLSGPIGIARASKNAAQKLGWTGVFWMLWVLSLNLGILNLLPIPVLDGGAIFLLGVESVLSWLGVRMSMTVRERIQQVGFVFLLLLMGFVITNDILKEASNYGRSDEKPAATAPAK